MDRRNFIRDVGMATGCIMSSCGDIDGEDIDKSVKNGHIDKPVKNVVMVISDQFRDPVWFGENKLPNFTEFSMDSLTCSNSYVCSVPCTPSRACLFTGMGVEHNKMASNHSRDMDTQLSVGHTLRDIGYSTYYFGKWHLSGNGLPSSSYGFEFKINDCYNGSGDGYNYDDSVIKAFEEWLSSDEAKNGPWFVVVSLLNPHNICKSFASIKEYHFKEFITELPDNYYDVLDTPSHVALVNNANDGRNMVEHLNAYYCLCKDTDRSLGKVLNLLQGDELVVFTADHGEMGGSHQLRGKPPVIYDEAIKVPLVIRGCGLHGINKTVIGNTDVMATVLGVLGYSNYFNGEDLSYELLNGLFRDRSISFKAIGGKHNKDIAVSAIINSRGRFGVFSYKGLIDTETIGNPW